MLDIFIFQQMRCNSFIEKIFPKRTSGVFSIKKRRNRGEIMVCAERAFNLVQRTWL